MTDDDARPGPFVTAEWLSEHRGDITLIDARWYPDGRSGRVAYERSHGPGATFIDLDEWLSGPPSAESGRHPLPSPERFVDAMELHGINDDAIVVAYDDAGGVIAARLVWMLRVTGHRAAVLDGGLRVFGAVTESGPGVTPPRGSFTMHGWPTDALAVIDEVTETSHVVIDARSRERYEGVPDPLDPRCGHIPGARSLPCRESLDEDGFLQPAPLLRARFVDAGVVEGADVVSYCGSGVTACHNLLVMEWLGLGVGRLFPGSWSSYASDPSRPIEVSHR